MLTATAPATGLQWPGRGASRINCQAAAQARPAAPDTPAAAVAPTAPPVCFVEPEESFLAQSARGVALSIATLGLYSFWVRAEARRQLHRSVRVGGDPLDFTGTGGEALASFVVGTVTTVVVVSVFLYFFKQSGATGAELRAAMSDFRLRRLFISIPLLFLLGSVAYRKRKQVLRRTWWRGQRFDLDGQPWAYAAQHFWTAMLVPLTFGWAIPWRADRLERRKIREMHRGGERFAASPDLGRLYRAFAYLWVGGGLVYLATMVMLGLTIGEPLLAALAQQSIIPLMAPGVRETGFVVVGTGMVPVVLSLIAYRAAWIEHQIGCLAIDGRRLEVALPRLRFIGMVIVNFVLKLATFGAFQPVAHAAVVRFVVRRIRHAAK